MPAKSGAGRRIFELLKRGEPTEQWNNLEEFFVIFALEHQGGSCIFSATVWGWVTQKIVFQLSDFAGQPTSIVYDQSLISRFTV